MDFSSALHWLGTLLYWVDNQYTQRRDSPSTTSTSRNRISNTTPRRLCLRLGAPLCRRTVGMDWILCRVQFFPCLGFVCRLYSIKPNSSSNRSSCMVPSSVSRLSFKQKGFNSIYLVTSNVEYCHTLGSRPRLPVQCITQWILNQSFTKLIACLSSANESILYFLFLFSF
jgi:hypothetical protein